MAQHQTIERRGNAPSLDSSIPTPRGFKRVWLSYWETPEALASHVATMSPEDSGRWHKGAWTNSESFAGSKDMAHAIDLCRSGWPAGAKRAAKLRDQINAANPMGPRVVKWDVAGAVASVPRALAGNPLAMRRVDSARLRRRPVLTLLSDMSANGGVSASAITNRAAVVAAVVDAVEAAGFACEVVTFECSAANGTAQIVATTVKESSAPADIGRLAFALGHASFFRRLAWAAFTSDAFTSELGGGLGVATRIDEQAANAQGAYILPSAERAESSFKTESAAATDGLAYLIAALRKQDCPAFPRVDSDAA